MTYLNTKSACKALGVHPNTLRNWDKDGKIKTIRTPGNRRLYDITSIQSTTKDNIIYARVSSKAQEDDLQKQIQYLRTRYPNHELIQDFGSGLNFKRKGFKALLERVLSGGVQEIVVAHRDRLCRFGFDLFQIVANQFGTKLVVLDDTQQSPQAELVTDLLSIVHVFSCRLYGLRKYSNQIKKDKDLPNQTIKTTI
jgi:predicted site-specific integrase-resolvase